MITVNLTNDQFVMLQRLVHDGCENESRLAYESQWPANGYHEANVRLLDGIDDTLRDAVADRIRKITPATT